MDDFWLHVCNIAALTETLLLFLIFVFRFYRQRQLSLAAKQQNHTGVMQFQHILASWPQLQCCLLTVGMRELPVHKT